MKISVFGIGYVGAVTAACAARDGHTVIAVDVNPLKVKTINAGESPIVEPGLDHLIKGEVQRGRLAATSDIERAIEDTDLSLVCVGTPSMENGGLDLTYVSRVAGHVGATLGRKAGFHSVVLRSTALPGTTEELLIPALEKASGKRAGQDFGVAYYPEFLRESTAIRDYDDPGAVVFGQLDDRTIEQLQRLQVNLPVKPFVVPIRTAEAVKYFNNAWHALKISFANEAGNVCKSLGVDGHEMMNILCSDTRLNISRSYMRPGFAYGGSCLPKDVRALRHRARQAEVPTPVLDGVAQANEAQIDGAFRLIERAGGKKVSLLGLSFKQDTDDLRESPMVILAERLLGKGYDLAVFDANVRLSRLTGANLAYLNEHLPHVARMLREDLNEVVEHGQTLVIYHPAYPAQIEPEMLAEKKLIDLVRFAPGRRSEGAYEGICW